MVLATHPLHQSVATHISRLLSMSGLKEVKLMPVRETTVVGHLQAMVVVMVGQAVEDGVSATHHAGRPQEVVLVATMERVVIQHPLQNSVQVMVKVEVVAVVLTATLPVLVVVQLSGGWPITGCLDFLAVDPKDHQSVGFVHIVQDEYNQTYHLKLVVVALDGLLTILVEVEVQV